LLRNAYITILLIFHEFLITDFAESKGPPANGEWFVVVDAAALVSCSPLDLSRYSPDFVTLSFYKMFGFPTGKLPKIVQALLFVKSSLS